MSVFGVRLAEMRQLIDDEFASDFLYQPMLEVVNAEPVIDTGRAAGACRAILLQPGQMLGTGWGLNQMHTRATSEPTLFWMARGILADVRKYDQFHLTVALANYPDRVVKYEVGDGPQPYGFGRLQATLVELTLLPAPVTPPTSMTATQMLARNTRRR